jgi:hypothetical protein
VKYLSSKLNCSRDLNVFLTHLKIYERILIASYCDIVRKMILKNEQHFHMKYTNYLQFFIIILKCISRQCASPSQSSRDEVNGRKVYPFWHLISRVFFLLCCVYWNENGGKGKKKKMIVEKRKNAWIFHIFITEKTIFTGDICT